MVITRISEPMMNSIPSIVIHSNANHFLGQILDNKIVVYNCKYIYFIKNKNYI